MLYVMILHSFPSTAGLRVMTSTKSSVLKFRRLTSFGLPSPNIINKPTREVKASIAELKTQASLSLKKYN